MAKVWAQEAPANVQAFPTLGGITRPTATQFFGNTTNSAAIATALGASFQPVDAALTALATGSDFVVFTGPLTSNKTFTLPNASSTILTSNAAVTVAQGGTNATTASITAFNNITGYTASGATGTTSTNLVFSASPTLTGTVTAPKLNSAAASDLVLGTASFNSGNALTFTSATGAATFAGQVNIGLSQTDPSLQVLATASGTQHAQGIRVGSSSSIYYDIYRDAANGPLIFFGAQSGFSAFTFTSTIASVATNVLTTDATTGSVTFQSAASTSNSLRIFGNGTTSLAQILMRADSASRQYNFGVGAASEVALGVANKFYLYDNSAGALRLTVDTSGNFNINQGLTVGASILGSGGSAPTTTTSGSNQFTAGIATSGPGFFGSDITAVGTSGTLLNVDVSSGAANPLLQFKIAGVAKGLIGVAGAAGNIVGSSLVNSLAMRSAAGVFISGDGGTTATAKFDSSNNTTLAGNLTVSGTGSTNHGGPVGLKNYTVAALPSGLTSTYCIAIVTDATLTTITGLGLAPTGGGSNKVPVYTTDGGTTWIMFE